MEWLQNFQEKLLTKCDHQGKPTWSAIRYQPDWTLWSSISPKSSLINQGQLTVISYDFTCMTRAFSWKKNKLRRPHVLFFVVGIAPFLLSPPPLSWLFICCTLQMKGRWESNINVWFPFRYFQKWNSAASLFSKQNYNVLSPSSSTYISVRDLYISVSVCLFFCSQICGQILGICKSLTDTWIGTEAAQFLFGNK